ncbi:MAG: N-acetyl-gamma-glutamyl-phosphate reductase [Clostridia bacterium]
MIRTGIIGATGYAGVECVRLLSAHPGFDVSCLVSKSFEGFKISDVYPSLAGICDIACEALDYDIILNKADCFISALPHAASQEVVHTLVMAGKKVVDLSADYRYSSACLYENTYNSQHHYPELLEKAVYGLPEFNREKIRDAVLVANPGCYPTCSILGLAPLVAKGLIDNGTITISAVSGVSGAGRKTELDYQFCECDGNFAPYKITGHRHTTEIEEQLSILAGTNIAVGFTPHLAPMKRGMSATIFAKAVKKTSSSGLIDMYKEFYKGNPFIRIKEGGAIPSIKAVAGSNFADIAPFYDGRLDRIIVVSAIDNLGKGASSQAVQNLNIMYGYDETAGLMNAGAYI